MRRLLFSVVGIFIVFGTLSYCSSDSELKPEPPKLIDIEVITVKRSDYLRFISSYQTFINGLNESQRGLLDKFVEDEEAKTTNAKTSVEASCECQPGQNKCSASSWFSSCCICWNPNTHEGACGEYWGVATCKTEAIIAPARSVEEDGIVTFNPKRMSGMLNYATQNGMNTKKIGADLSILVSLATTE